MKYEKILRQLRASDKIWSLEHEEQVLRIIRKCKDRMLPTWDARHQAHVDAHFHKVWND